MTTHSEIPSTLTSGDAWGWTVQSGDYPAGDGWVMSYVLINSAAKIDISSTADGDDHVVDYDSTGEAAGRYQYQQYFIKAGDRKTGVTGSVEVAPDFALAATLDNRSHNRKVLDAIEATIEGSASKSQSSVSIAGRALSERSYDELLTLKREYAALWRTELRDAARANGQSVGGRVFLKMGGN